MVSITHTGPATSTGASRVEQIAFVLMVAARRLAPSRVFSIRYQVAMHTISENTTTQPR